MGQTSSSQWLRRAFRRLTHLSIPARILAIGLVSLALLMVTTLLTVRQVATDVMLEQYWSNSSDLMVMVQRELLAWCERHGVTPQSLSGLAHRGGLATSH